MVAGKWRYVYRALEQHGQVIDVCVVSARLPGRRFFARALRAHGDPVEVVTDRAPALRAAIEGLVPAALHNTEQHANNRVECDHDSSEAPTDPRTQTRPHRMSGHARPRARAEHPPRALRTWRTRAVIDESKRRSPNSPGRSERHPQRSVGSALPSRAQRNRAAPDSCPFLALTQQRRPTYSRISFGTGRGVSTTSRLHPPSPTPSTVSAISSSSGPHDAEHQRPCRSCRTTAPNYETQAVSLC